MSTPDFSRDYFHVFHNIHKKNDYTYNIVTRTLNPGANEDWVAEMTGECRRLRGPLPRTSTNNGPFRVTRGALSMTFKTQSSHQRKILAKNEVAYYALLALGLSVLDA